MFSPLICGDQLYVIGGLVGQAQRSPEFRLTMSITVFLLRPTGA
jgi:hypothetical protein